MYSPADMLLEVIAILAWRPRLGDVRAALDKATDGTRQTLSRAIWPRDAREADELAAIVEHVSAERDAMREALVAWAEDPAGDEDGSLFDAARRAAGLPPKVSREASVEAWADGPSILDDVEAAQRAAGLWSEPDERDAEPSER